MYITKKNKRYEDFRLGKRNHEMKKNNHKWIMLYFYPQQIEGRKKHWLAKKYGHSKKELQKWYNENKKFGWNLIQITKIY